MQQKDMEGNQQKEIEKIKGDVGNYSRRFTIFHGKTMELRTNKGTYLRGGTGGGMSHN